jgi:hypothetical protein
VANLLDIIKKNTSRAAQVPAPTAGPSETAKAAELLRAKSGRDTAGLGPGVGQTNLAEQAAVQDTNTTLQQQFAPAAELQNQQTEIAQQEVAQTEANQLAETQQRGQALSQQAQIKMQELLQGIQQDKGSLALQKEDARVDQIMTLARLSNEKYRSTLELEGNRQRLKDENEFRTNLLETVFGEELKILQGKVDFIDLYNENDRNFKQAMSDIKIESVMAETEFKMDDLSQDMALDWEYKLKGLDLKNRTANERAKYTAMSDIITGLAEGGAGILDANAKAEDKKKADALYELQMGKGGAANLTQEAPRSPLEGQGRGIRDAQALDNFRTKA